MCCMLRVGKMLSFTGQFWIGNKRDMMKPDGMGVFSKTLRS